MRIAYVVSDLTYPPKEGLHEQTLLTAELIGGLGRTVDLFGYVRHPNSLDLSAMAAEKNLRFAAPPITNHLPNLLLGLRNAIFPSRSSAELIEKIASYDVIHLENVGACGLVRRSSAGRTVAGVVDPGSLRWARMAASAQSCVGRTTAEVQRRLHGWLEKMASVRGATLQVVSEVDADYLAKQLPLSEVEAIPVSLAIEATSKVVAPLPQTKQIVVFIDLRRPHLRRSFLWAVQEVLPVLIKETAGSATINVLGRVEPDSELLASAADLPINFVPWVENLADELRNAALVLVPDRTGTGLKNRVVQAMALGCPVAGTSVAFEGIPAKDGQEAIIEEDGQRLATRAAALLNDQRARTSMAKLSRDFALARYSRAANAQRWHSLHDRLANCTRDST